MSVAVVVQGVHQLLVELLHGLKNLYYYIAPNVYFAAHALADPFGCGRLLVLLVLVLPPLVGVEDQSCPIRDWLKRLREHFRHQTHYRSITEGVANQITVMQNR